MRIIILSFFLHSVGLFAQRADTVFLYSDTAVSHTFDDVLVKASRYEVLVKNIAGSVQVLQKNNIQAAEQAGLSNILNQVPGVQMQSGGFQTSRLSIRGVGSRNPYGSGRIRAFYEDIPLSAGDGTTVIEDLEPFFIEKAEITKGPNSAWYGSGLGGSIRFFGPNSSFLERDTIQLFTQGGSYGYWKAGGLASVSVNKAQVSAGLSQVEGEGHRENSRYFKRSFLLSGSAGEKHRINYLLQFNDVKSHIPSSIDENTYLNNPEKAAPNWNRVQGYKKYQRFIGGIRLESKLSLKLTNTLSVSGSLNDPYELRPFNILDDKSKSFQIQEQMQVKWKSHLFLGGIEILRENYQWRILQNNSLVEQQKSKETRDQWNTFVSWEWNIIDKLSFTTGLNLNQTSYEVKDLFANDSIDYSGKTNRKPIFSPRIGINYAFHRNVNIYSSFGHGFSNPTVEESLNSQGFINSDLKPEEGWGYDAGVRVYLFKRNLWLDFVFYQIQLEELLVTHRVTEEIFSGANAGSANLRGLELFTHYKPSKRMQLWFTYQQSLNKFKSFTSDSVNYSDRHLPGIPSFNLKADIQYFIFKSFDLGLNYTITGKQYLNDSNSLQVPLWQMTEFRMGYKKAFKSWGIQLQSGIRNITQEHYPSMVLINAPSFGKNAPRYYYPGMPRNYYVSVEVSF